MTCLPRMESSGSLLKERCLFHSRGDGSTMITAIFMKTILTIVAQKGSYYFWYLQGRKKAQLTVLLLTQSFKFPFIVGCAAYFLSNMRVLHSHIVLHVDRTWRYETVEKKIFILLQLVTNWLNSGMLPNWSWWRRELYRSHGMGILWSCLCFQRWCLVFWQYCKSNSSQPGSEGSEDRSEATWHHGHFSPSHWSDGYMAR